MLTKLGATDPDPDGEADYGRIAAAINKFGDMKIHEIVGAAGQGMLSESVEDGWAYHGTLLDKVPSISRFGLQSNHRPKWSWDDSNKRQYHLLYFSLSGPQGWGKHKNHHAEPHELVELRFPFHALGRKHWQEDDERPERDEYYAESRREFTIPPAVVQILYKDKWMPIQEFYRDHYWDTNT